MDKKMKHTYQVPTIKVVSFKVEAGFYASPLKAGTLEQSGSEELVVQDWYTH